MFRKKKDEARSQFTFLAKIIEGTPILEKESEQLLRGECIEELKWFDKAEIKGMKGEDFISNRTYVIIQDWLVKEVFPLEAVKQIEM